MSTRCQITFYPEEPKSLNNFVTNVYIHSDGYPEGIIPRIKPFLENWKKTRGIKDISYCAARLLQHLCNDFDKDLDDSKTGKIYKQLGFGIMNDFQGDIEYLYAIYPNKIIVYDIDFAAEETDINDRAHRIDTIEI